MKKTKLDKVAFIGSGRMAEALISGLIKSKQVIAEDIITSDVRFERLEQIKEDYRVRVTAVNQEAADFARIIVIAVKPQMFQEAVLSLKVDSQKLVISIAAGITLDTLKKYFPENPLVRVMPNNPALIGQGLSAVCAGDLAKEDDLQLTEQIFKAVGKTVEVDEKLMDAVTALSGSGPAFIYLMAETMIETGISLGLTKNIAQKLVLQTLLGSAQTVLKSKKSPRELKEMVTSPNGTTQAGLAVLENNKFAEALIEAIIAAAKRSHELSLEWT